MIDGDIYTWEWADPKRLDRADVYWCQSQTAIVIAGKLYDTFWMHHGGKYVDGKGWGPRPANRSLHPGDVMLTYVANLDGLHEVRPEELRYYEPEDIVDLRHRNNTNAPTYIRKGAWRSKRAILREIDMARAAAQYDLKIAKAKCDRLDKAEQYARAGLLDSVEL